MRASFVIERVRDTGPTDGHCDDTLYVVVAREGDAPPETLRFTVAATYGRPSEEELGELVRQRAAAFGNARDVVEQFRALEIEHPEGSGRRVVFVKPVPE